jgi:6-pyruvoyltetrahydropterin/6-carboxytetrahydropterin synthase
MIYLTRRFDFAASHRLFNPEFSDELNWEIFRDCNNPNGHGHNYELEVTIAGEADPKTGMLINILLLDEIVREQLIRHVDHKNLNIDVDFLQDIIPTAENICVVFWKQLAQHIPAPHQLYRLRLQESKNNFAEYYGPVQISKN